MAVVLKTGYEGITEYVPKYGGNRIAAESGQPYWHVLLLPANKDEMRGLMYKAKGSGLVARSEEGAAKKIVSERVVGVSGLTLEAPDGSRTTPLNGQELWGAFSGSSLELNTIAGELIEAVSHVSTLEEGLLKNLPTRSGTSAQPTDRETGVATTAPNPKTES